MGIQYHRRALACSPTDSNHIPLIIDMHILQAIDSEQPVNMARTINFVARRTVGVAHTQKLLDGLITGSVRVLQSLLQLVSGEHLLSRLQLLTDIHLYALGFLSMTLVCDHQSEDRTQKSNQYLPASSLHSSLLGPCSRGTAYPCLKRYVLKERQI